MKYGIRFTYIGGGQSSEAFYETEEERNENYTKIANAEWKNPCIFGRTIINLANVIYCEKIEV